MYHHHTVQKLHGSIFLQRDLPCPQNTGMELAPFRRQGWGHWRRRNGKHEHHVLSWVVQSSPKLP